MEIVFQNGKNFICLIVGDDGGLKAICDKMQTAESFKRLIPFGFRPKERHFHPF
jgi:hypothetical protein